MGTAAHDGGAAGESGFIDGGMDVAKVREPRTPKLVYKVSVHASSS